jgi:hypothetical protein
MANAMAETQDHLSTFKKLDRQIRQKHTSNARYRTGINLSKGLQQTESTTVTTKHPAAFPRTVIGVETQPFKSFESPATISGCMSTG